MPLLRRALTWLLAGACVVLAMVALDALAKWRLRSHLDASASETLRHLLGGRSPHHWSAAVAADIVAARAFGSEQGRIDAQGLHVRAEARPFEIGFVVARPIDLGRHTRVRLDLEADSAMSIAIVASPNLDAPTCNSPAIRVPAGAREASIPLHEDAWQCAGEPAKAPAAAAMLRIHVEMPEGAVLNLQTAALELERGLDARRLDTLPLPLLPAATDMHSLRRALARIVADAPGQAWPIVQLPLDGRVEQVLAARGEIQNAIPDALIVPKGDFPAVAAAALQESAPAARAPEWKGWLFTIALALVLLALRLRPPLGTRLRAGLELLGVLVVPTVLIGGDFIGDDIAPPAIAACVATFAFAISLLFGAAPAQPGSRTMKRGWWVGLATLLLAAGLILVVNGGHIEAPRPSLQHALRYLAWAGAQQFLICVIVAGRIQAITGSAWVARIGSALVFALLHTPNALLMQLSFVGGLVWIWNWQRHRALGANIVAHTLCGLLLTANLPADWLHSAEVSARYFLSL